MASAMNFSVFLGSFDGPGGSISLYAHNVSSVWALLGVSKLVCYTACLDDSVSSEWDSEGRCLSNTGSFSNSRLQHLHSGTPV